MISGGYKLVDFKGNNLTTTNTDGITIDGIYDSIENSYGKMLVASGIVLEGVEKNNVGITAISGDNSYTISMYGSTVTITSTDNVKITT